ncbi:hypothetical protein ACM66B_000143 [Microbotryomycetes sp. NB124-2]
MPPLRLPKKSSKNKAKPIDYTSIQTALSSTDLDYDGWLEEGVAQQDQGDRYANSAGPKSARHLHNAVTAFECANKLNPMAFDAPYNAARVVQQLATDYLPPPQCSEAISRAIRMYEACLAWLSTEDERIDVTFNRAQAYVTRYEMEVEHLSNNNEPAHDHWLTKGIELFEETERLQVAAMNRVFGDQPNQQSQNEPSSMDLDSTDGISAAEANTPGDATDIATATATEARTVTPHIVLETVIETLQAQLLLLQAGGNNNVDLETSIRNRLELGAKLDQAGENTDLALARIELAWTMRPERDTNSFFTILNEYSRLRERLPQHLGLLSSFADFLTENLTDATSKEVQSGLIDQAQTLYLEAERLLSSRLRPPPGVPPFSVPSLLTSNLVSQAFLKLAKLGLGLVQDSTEAQKTRKFAMDLCVRAVNFSKTSNVIVSVSSLDGSITIQSLGSAQVKDLKVYATSFKSLRQAWFMLWRCWAFKRQPRSSKDANGWTNDMLKGWLAACGILNRDAKVDLRALIEEWSEDVLWSSEEGARWTALL